MPTRAAYISRHICGGSIRVRRQKMKQEKQTRKYGLEKSTDSTTELSFRPQEPLNLTS